MFFGLRCSFKSSIESLSSWCSLCLVIIRFLNGFEVSNTLFGGRCYQIGLACVWPLVWSAECVRCRFVCVADRLQGYTNRADDGSTYRKAIIPETNNTYRAMLWSYCSYTQVYDNWEQELALSFSRCSNHRESGGGNAAHSLSVITVLVLTAVKMSCCVCPDCKQDLTWRSLWTWV